MRANLVLHRVVCLDFTIPLSPLPPLRYFSGILFDLYIHPIYIPTSWQLPRRLSTFSFFVDILGMLF